METIEKTKKAINEKVLELIGDKRTVINNILLEKPIRLNIL